MEILPRNSRSDAARADEVLNVSLDEDRKFLEQQKHASNTYG